MVFFVPSQSGDAGATGSAGADGSVGTGDFGSIYSNGISVAQVTGAAFAKLVGLFTTNGIAMGGGVTPDAANDRLVINTTGDYALWVMVSPLTTAGTVFSIKPRRNGVALSLANLAGQHTLSSSPLWGSARTKGSVSLVAGDVIEVYGRNNAALAVTFTDAQLYAKRLA